MYHFKRCIVGPPAKLHLNDVLRPNIECWLGSFVAFQGIRTRIAKKPYIFVIFQGGGALDPPISFCLSGPSKIFALFELMTSLRLTRMSYVFVFVFSFCDSEMLQCARVYIRS